MLTENTNSFQNGGSEAFTHAEADRIYAQIAALQEALRMIQGDELLPPDIRQAKSTQIEAELAKLRAKLEVLPGGKITSTDMQVELAEAPKRPVNDIDAAA